ncbi:unnamed protein product [Durusdinium trenchii]|uniref:Uncharacterized protein n=1 Tax=Durusdinium trenchii TaxID=1381693 RepID=A0ABP0J713_9DINO
MDFGMQPDFLALWKQEKTQLALGHSLWPVTGKRKAEDWTAETWKKRRHEKVESFPKDARFSTHDEVALLEVFGARCADLPTLLASVGWAAALMAILLAVLCFSESIIAAMICSSLLAMLAMVSVASQVLSISYEGAWAI